MRRVRRVSVSLVKQTLVKQTKWRNCSRVLSTRSQGIEPPELVIAMNTNENLPPHFCGVATTKTPSSFLREAVVF